MKELIIPIFPAAVYFAKGGGVERAIKRRKMVVPEKNRQELCSDNFGATFRLQGTEHLSLLLWLEKPKRNALTHATIAHECIHLAYEILAHSEIEPSEELVAYLADYLVEEATEYFLT